MDGKLDWDAVGSTPQGRQQRIEMSLLDFGQEISMLIPGRETRQEICCLHRGWNANPGRLPEEATGQKTKNRNKLTSVRE